MRKLHSSFVSAEPQPGELDPLMEHSLTKNPERDFLTPLLENIGGGLGMFTLAFVLYEWIAGWDTYTILWVAGRWSGGLFAGMCIIRFWGDEIQKLFYHISRGWAEGRAKQDFAHYKNECERLEIELRQANAANAQMVRHVKVTTGRDELPNPAPRMAEDEYTGLLRDALALCRYQDAHGKISRDDVVAAGEMDRPRWGAARGLLINAGVQVQNGVIATSSAQAMGLVRQFVEKQRKQPSDFVAPYEQ